MGKIKIRTSTVAIILILTLNVIAGCGITVTKNYYYTNPNEGVKKINKDKAPISQPTDTAIDNQNEGI